MARGCIRSRRRRPKQNVADFTTRVLAILEAPYPLVEDTRNELNPRPLPFSAEATKLYWEFADETEKAMAPDGEYESIRPFAAKLPEHAARIAATIAGYRDIHVSELGRDDFVRGIHHRQLLRERGKTHRRIQSGRSRAHVGAEAARLAVDGVGTNRRSKRVKSTRSDQMPFAIAIPHWPWRKFWSTTAGSNRWQPSGRPEGMADPL